MTNTHTRDTLITAADLTGHGRSDLLIREGTIIALGKDAREQANDPHIIDADGLIALPGLVDLHTHLREPGQEDAETVFTGTRAAAVGGYTAVHAMANTTPVADTASVVEQVWQLGRKAGWVDVRPVGAVTVGLEGKRLSAMGAMARSRAAVRMFSDDGKCVSDPVLMRRALEYVKAFDGVVAQHAQDPELTDGAQMNESPLSGELGLTGWPAVAEEAIIARDVLLAKHVGSRLHVCHLSTAGSVDIVRWAKRMGVQVSAEVTPHHLFLTEERATTYDPLYKVNPPLRSAEDVEAVREGLADGTIDAIGTDHAPHPLESKDCEWQAGAFGMTGLETALPVVIATMVETGRFTWADVARVMSITPARIGRVHTQGQGLNVGAPAHVTLLDPSIRRVVDPHSQWTRSSNSPFVGAELPGQVLYTFYAGQPTVALGVPLEKESR
ncbi:MULTISPECIES: dihydroorotase [unclassified Schaalia]|uniref:dihydroorotase n=1 Tax=unclassified Schaalia TaxID=2691889 RepID=UPI001E48A196|nr:MULTISPECIES: dihydroorotase [unclassified Schaalia]MCD4549554.1 dihydroorotase [Schaalia sp. lx-260]MCD4558175.1 dihydroorotase [Schaalia sp. lx-100]